MSGYFSGKLLDFLPGSGYWDGWWSRVLDGKNVSFREEPDGKVLAVRKDGSTFPAGTNTYVKPRQDLTFEEVMNFKPVAGSHQAEIEVHVYTGARRFNTWTNTRMMHGKVAEFGNALFQIASNFNIIEGTGENHVVVDKDRNYATTLDYYCYDTTQGPISCMSVGFGAASRMVAIMKDCASGKLVPQTASLQACTLGRAWVGSQMQQNSMPASFADPMTDEIKQGNLKPVNGIPCVVNLQDVDTSAICNIRNGYPILNEKVIRDLGPNLDSALEKLWHDIGIVVTAGSKTCFLPDFDKTASADSTEDEQIGYYYNANVPTATGYLTVDHACCTGLNLSQGDIGYANSECDKLTNNRLSELVLMANYMATYNAALTNSNSTVVLTLVGGGVFGNSREAIIRSIARTNCIMGDPACKLRIMLPLFSAAMATPELLAGLASYGAHVYVVEHGDVPGTIFGEVTSVRTIDRKTGELSRKDEKKFQIVKYLDGLDHTPTNFPVSGLHSMAEGATKCVVCGQAASGRCNCSALYSYCSSSCQHSDWSAHRSEHRAVVSAEWEPPLHLRRGKGGVDDRVVLCMTRRSDGVANREIFEPFIRSLYVGEIKFEHPQFAINRVMQPHQYCRAPTTPDEVAIISWWSKDYHNLIEDWPKHANVLGKYKHHFSFTINNEARSVLEPGIESTIAQRIAQIAWLVDKCRELGQDPDYSILIRVDPMIRYTIPGDDLVHDNLGHIPLLCQTLQRHGLTRLHTSFMQFGWAKLKSRLKKMSDKVHFFELSGLEEQRKLFETSMLPYTSAAGVRVQTCTAMDLVGYYKDRSQLNMVQGACAGERDMHGLVPGLQKPRPECITKASSVQRWCTCWPYKDVGSQHTPCPHGCRYCFENPSCDDW